MTPELAEARAEMRECTEEARYATEMLAELHVFHSRAERYHHGRELRIHRRINQKRRRMFRAALEGLRTLERHMAEDALIRADTRIQGIR